MTKLPSNTKGYVKKHALYIRVSSLIITPVFFPLSGEHVSGSCPCKSHPHDAEKLLSGFLVCSYVVCTSQKSLDAGVCFSHDATTYSGFMMIQVSTLQNAFLREYYMKVKLCQQLQCLIPQKIISSFLTVLGLQLMSMEQAYDRCCQQSWTFI